MAMRLQTPVNQVRLTNVAVVRLRKAGKRFELACYKNKVMSWRQKSESDIDEVLQTHTIFTNVSKGEAAKQQDLIKAFKTDDEAKIVLEILNKGQLQVSERERNHALGSTYREIAMMVSDQTVDPNTRKPYPVTLIETAMKEAHYAVKPQKSVKVQALEVIKLLQASIPIERAQMKIMITFPTEFKNVKEKMKDIVNSVESTDIGSEVEMICFIDPGKWREIGESLQQNTKGKGSVEIISLRTNEASGESSF